MTLERVPMFHAAPLIAALLLLAGAPVAGASSASAEGGLAVTPTDISYGSVMRDEPIERAIEVHNSRNSSARVTFEATGELGGWLRDLPAALEVPARAHLRIPLKLQAPTDAPNGAHVGNVTVVMRPAAEPDASSGVGASFALAVNVQLSATLGGEELVRVAASRLTVGTTEEGDTVPISIRVQNLGNVRVAPVVRLEILRADRSPVSEETRTLDPVRPGTDVRVDLGIPAPAAQGQYWLRATVIVGSTTIYEDIGTFDVVRKGALRQNGVMGAIDVIDMIARSPTNRILAGNAFQVQASFANTGEGSVEATFRGHLMREGRLVTALASETLRVHPEENVTFRILLHDVVEPGVYLVVGQVHYGEKVTEQNEFILRIDDAPTPKQTPAGALPIIAGAAIAAALLVARRPRKVAERGKR